MALVGRSAGPTGKAAAVLSRSETQVVPLLLDGLGNKVIAQRLGILEPAVKSRLRGIYRKMGVVNRAQAVMALLADNPQANGRYLRIVATH
jgi:DNA-binding NarL/FixJ family response regulator